MARRRRLAPAELRASLATRLGERRAEIEEMVLRRVESLHDPTEVADPVYVEGLRGAVRAAVDYGIAGVGRGESRPAAIPAELLAQARHAARGGVGLDTVLRRYFAGHSLLGDFLDQEAGAIADPAALRVLRRDLAALLDRLVAAAAEAYAREAAASSPARRLKIVQRLLAGELLDTAELQYRFEGWHLGVVVTGREAEATLRKLAGACDRSLLAVEAEHESIWGWLGGREPLDPGSLFDLVAELLPVEAHVALGEPGLGTVGWTWSHRQAQAALSVALRGGPSWVRYTDVALVAAALRDQVLARSLHGAYLAPLARGRDGGDGLRQTLEAYFSVGRNVSSTAALLGVSRTTVKSRLQVIEERLGRPLADCTAEMETALRLHRLDWAAAE